MNARPYNVYDVEGSPRRRWVRILIWTLVGLLILVLAVGGGSYLWFRGQVSEANQRVDPEVKAVLAEKPSSTLVSTGGGETADIPESPDAMNILVLGSDHRETEEEEYGRSDTMILVHIDPDLDYLSVMSLPRDLRVKIPDVGYQKLNAAFAYGGAALTIRTVEALTGVDINHYIEVDFNAFSDITDALGGVYVDVDRRYYNDDPRYELIKLAPGYQLLRGDDALDYVRFRHDRNADFGRMERQQRFLSAIREQAMGWNLPFKLPGLVSALFGNIDTDLGANDIIKLAYWGVKLDGSRIRQISVTGGSETIDGLSYVVVGETAMAEAVGSFLSPPEAQAGGNAGGGTVATSDTTSTTLAAVDLGGVEVDVLNANGRAGEAAAAAGWLRGAGATVVMVGNSEEQGLETTTVRYPSGEGSAAEQVAGMMNVGSVTRSSAVDRVTVLLGDDFSLPRDYALPPSPSTIPGAGGWRTLAEMVPFPLQAPAYLPEGYAFVERMPPEGATYDIEVDGGTEPAMKMLYRFFDHGKTTDQYMGFTSTTWLDAPAASDGRTVKRGGIVFTVVGSDQKVERVWWKADGVLYWVSNTLSYLLDEQELLAVAESMIPIPKP